MTVRRLTKFVALGGVTTYSLSLGNGEWVESQPLRTPSAAIIGGDGSHDYLGSGIAPKDSIEVTVRFVKVMSCASGLESDMDALRSKLHLGAFGKLWTIDSVGAQRWSGARLTTMPQLDWAVGEPRHQAIVLRFRREPYWYSKSATSGSQELSAYQTFVTVTNPGTSWVKKYLTLSLTALTAAGITNPHIRNLTTGESVESTRGSGAIGNVWRIDNSEQVVAFKRAPGLKVGAAGSYVGQAPLGNPDFEDDYGLATLGVLQSGLFSLAPGANILEILIEGTPSATFAYSFSGAWE